MMKKRLCTVLLAIVMVLSITITAYGNKSDPIIIKPTSCPSQPAPDTEK